MHINDLPQELFADILLLAAKANEADGVAFTYGLMEVITPLGTSKTTKFSKYVRGPLSAESLRWDATHSIRQVCRQWHDWALSYNLEHVFERRWRGNERWADLTMTRDKYRLYELIDKPSGWPLRRDPHGSLKHTDRLFASVPSIAQHVRRLWFNGFYSAEMDRLILSIVANCRQLQYLSVPWTILRRGTVADWVNLLNADTGLGEPLLSLELTAVCLPRDQADALEADNTPNPLRDPRVSFHSLKRLKIFGNSLHKPLMDTDLHLIARTATNLECLDITNISTISVAGMLALVKASRHTLQVLEHSPRSDDGFYHPFPGHLTSGEHICHLLTTLPQMRDLSLSVPYICADVFASDDVKWAGELQIRTTDLCGCDTTTTPSSSPSALRASSLQNLLDAARTLVSSRRRTHNHLSIQLFFANCIFQPEKSLVHGNFTLAEISSGGRWPRRKQMSTLGPYGQTGLYGKEEGVWDEVGEEVWFEGVRQGWIAL